MKHRLTVRQREVLGWLNRIWHGGICRVVGRRTGRESYFLGSPGGYHTLIPKITFTALLRRGLIKARSKNIYIITLVGSGALDEQS